MGKSEGRASQQGVAATTHRGWLMIIMFVAAAMAVALYFKTPAQAYARTAVAYSARVACSCRFVAGRSLEDCEKDKLEGMELVTLVEDPAVQSVTARFPLLAADTAIYREGYGCVLKEWSK